MASFDSLLRDLGDAMPEEAPGRESLARGLAALEHDGASAKLSYVAYAALLRPAASFARVCGCVRRCHDAHDVRVGADGKRPRKGHASIAFALAGNGRHGAASVRVSAESRVEVAAHTGVGGVAALNARLQHIFRAAGVESVRPWSVRLAKFYCFTEPFDAERARAAFAAAIARGDCAWQHVSFDGRLLRLSTRPASSPAGAELLASVLPCGTATLVCRSLPTLQRAGRMTVETLLRCGEGLPKKSTLAP
jgi:hypothetical protein